MRFHDTNTGILIHTVKVFDLHSYFKDLRLTDRVSISGSFREDGI